MPSAYDFIDRGDNCSDSGPPSSVGSYDDNDSFIDNGSTNASPLPLVHSSPLFVRADSTMSRMLDLVQPVRTPRLPMHAVRNSIESPVGFRRWRSRSPQRRRGETTISVERSGSRPFSVGASRPPTPTSRSGDSVTTHGIHGQVRGASSTPDPQLFPDHLRKDDLKGTGVPGTRLGSGRSRWASRFMLLTYPQCGYAWPYDEVVKLSETLDFQYHICREQHEDGGYHFHALLDFRRKFETENVHRFCVGTRRTGSDRACPGQAHCNILPVVRTPFNAWDYVGKYGDIVASNLDRPPARGPNTTRDDLWTGSMALSTKDAFLADVKKHSPRDYCLYPSSIKSSADSLFGVTRRQPDMPQLEPRGLTIHWDRYPSVRGWVLGSLSGGVEKIISTSSGSAYPEETQAVDRLLVSASPGAFPRKHRPKSLIIFGASRLGKSDFATSLGAHVQFRGTFNMDDMKEMDMDLIEYAVWDDVPWTDPALKHEAYKNWLGSQDNFNCTDRYNRKTRLKPWNKPSIYLANKNPFLGLDPQDVAWLEENCVIVDIGDSVEPGRRNAICSETKGR